jgi:hypothetical protein
VNGKHHGKGRFVYSDGSTYDGDWIDDNRHDKGVMRWVDGSVYEGE